MSFSFYINTLAVLMQRGDAKFLNGVSVELPATNDMTARGPRGQEV